MVVIVTVLPDSVAPSVMAMAENRGGALGLPMRDPLATTPAEPLDDQPVRPSAKAGLAKLTSLKPPTLLSAYQPPPPPYR